MACRRLPVKNEDVLHSFINSNHMMDPVVMFVQQKPTVVRLD